MSKRDREPGSGDVPVGPPRPPSSSSSLGPVGPSRPETKKSKTLEFESLYMSALPNTGDYELSFMHADHVSHVIVTATDFIMTGSVDGRVKFWKKKPIGIEYVKVYTAHLAPIVCLASSSDGQLAFSCASDGSLKLYDVVNFDMLKMMSLPTVPTCACFFSYPSLPSIIVYGDAAGDLYGVDLSSSQCHLFSPRLHRCYITNIASVITSSVKCIISTDARGMVEYTSPQRCWKKWKTKQNKDNDNNNDDVRHDDDDDDDVDISPYDVADGVVFKSKTDTDLYCLCKDKTFGVGMCVSHDGKRMAMMCRDWKVRVWRIETGRLESVWDEACETQRAPPEAPPEMQCGGVEEARRSQVATMLMKEMENDIQQGKWRKNHMGMCFDRSNHMLLMSGMHGIKVINVETKKVMRWIGWRESERFTQLALYQGSVKANLDLGESIRMHQQDNNNNGNDEDPTLFCTSFRPSSQRFYMLTRRLPRQAEEGKEETTGRDVYNERPLEEVDTNSNTTTNTTRVADVCVIHTTKGDIRIQLYPHLTPRTYENFVGHAQSGYYEGCVFHRVVKGFMIQSGDPTGKGTGGTSIWGNDFEDEICSDLRHDRAGMLSMANVGQPNTNGSQFFITTVPISRLDGRHTVFGKVERGMDVVMAIEKVPTDKDDRPYDPPSILSVELVQ